jgi:hypothetical protein
MTAATQLAVLLLGGALGGAAPDQTPAVAASTSVSVSCTRGMAHVALSAVPLYKEVVIATKWFTAMAGTTTTSVDVARGLGGKLLEVSFKMTGDER